MRRPLSPFVAPHWTRAITHGKSRGRGPISRRTRGADEHPRGLSRSCTVSLCVNQEKKPDASTAHVYIDSANSVNRIRSSSFPNRGNAASLIAFAV